MATKKYLSLERLKEYDALIKAEIAEGDASVKSYVDTEVAKKANSSHTHDDRYYTETEIDTKLDNKSDTSHNHDSDYDAKGSASAVQTNLNTVSDTIDSHIDDSKVHVTETEKAIWNSKSNFSGDYNDLTNKPTISASAIGLGNVNNTSDADKPVSTAQQTAIDTALTSAKSYTDTKTNGMATTTVVDNKISTHNTNTSAHSDIRELITGLTTRLNTLADSDDTTLDQMSEIVTYIKSNKSLIDSITTNKVNVSDIVNNLTTNVSNKPLSASQGVALKELINALQTVVNGKSDSGHTHTISNVTNLQSTLDTINAEVDGSIKSLSVSGKTITYTKNDGSTGIIITQDTNTDIKVNQAPSSTSNYRPIVLGMTNSTDTSVLAEDVTGAVNVTSNIYAQPSTGTIFANTFKGYLDGNAKTATFATSATSATKATQDGNGKVISNTYETKTDASSKLTESKTYTDTVVSGKADKTHGHAISDIANLQDSLDSKANQISLDEHDNNKTKHITSTERTNWNAAKTHADSDHDKYINQNAFSNVKVGSTTIAADSKTDTLELIGSNVTITPDATNDKVTIAVADGTTNAKGLVQLTNSTSSTSTTTAATPKSVKSAYDLANQAKTAATKAQTTANGKADANHIQSIDKGGTGCTSITDTTYTTARYRASSLHSTETNPSVNGVIAWTYE